MEPSAGEAYKLWRLARQSSDHVGGSHIPPRPEKGRRGSRPREVGMGERLMRAGSEGNLVQHKQPAPLPLTTEEMTPKMRVTPPTGKSLVTAISPENGDRPNGKQSCSDRPETGEGPNRKQSCSDRPETGEGPNGKQSCSDRPDPKSPRSFPRRHTVGGQQASRDPPAMQSSDVGSKRGVFLEILKQKYPHHASTIMGHREQGRIPKHSPSPLPVGHPTVAALESQNVMSEEEAPIAFTRNSRSRASLPVVRSTNQTKDRSLGVLYLQYRDEVKQAWMPNEITSGDTVRALFVSTFPQELTMKMLESPATAVYIKDRARNMFHELSDVRSITDHSCLKVYHKDPTQAFSRSSRTAEDHTGLSHAEGHHTLRQQSSTHATQGPLSPPIDNPLPPSPSRIPYGPRRSTLPRERLSSAPPACRATSVGPSAILERRDVKPDDDPHPDPPLSPQGTRLPDAVDHHRLYATTGDSGDHHSLYRQKSRKYSEGQAPALGSQTPPLSPHRLTKVRLMDAHRTLQAATLERNAPVRQSFRSGVTSPTFANLNHGPGDVAVPGDPQTRDRMKAMEKQIASLTGLVQHALLMGPNTSGSSEKALSMTSPVHSPLSEEVSPILATMSSAPLSDTLASDILAQPTDLAHLHVSLTSFRNNVSDLRLQLHQMRQLQLQNQENLKLMIKRVELEIGHKLAEVTKLQQDPIQRQRALLEDERHQYLGTEERVQEQLGEVERFIGELKEGWAATRRSITLQDVETGALHLTRVGESLTALKGRFPGLQGKMRAVLRVEVEAVRFLKEEPHKLDSMLRKVETLTETLSGLRRQATEHQVNGSELTALKVSSMEVVASPPILSQEPPVTPPSTPPAQPQFPSVRSKLVPATQAVVHHVHSTPVLVQPSQHSVDLPSPPTTPTGEQDSPALASTSPQSQENSPASQRKTSPSASPSPSLTPASVEEASASINRPQSRLLSVQAEREERRENPVHYDGREFDQILQEAQANLMKGIPDLEVSDRETDSAPSPVLPPKLLEDPPPLVDSPTARVTDETPPTEHTAEKPANPSPSNPIPANPSPGKPGFENADKANGERTRKSPPPPPPRRSHSSGSGLTTGRSGEVIFTTRKEHVLAQEEEKEATHPQRPRLSRISTECKSKPPPPPPIRDEEDEEDEEEKIMAELQVFQQCPVKDVGVKRYTEPTRVEPQHGQQKPGGPMLKDRQSMEVRKMEGSGNDSVRSSARVIYYVTAQISKEPRSPLTDEPTHHRGGMAPPSQVDAANSCQVSQKQLVPDQPQVTSHIQTGAAPAEATDTQVDQVTEREVEVDQVTEREVEVADMEVDQVTEREVEVDQERAMGLGANGVSHQTAMLRTVRARVRFVTDNSDSDNQSPSPAAAAEESPTSTDNIAFMITDTTVQALSCREYAGIVGTEAGNVQTFKVGDRREMNAQEQESSFDRKPVIILLEEPMDIRAAYKRLSTIFECEDELAEKRIKEEVEDMDSERNDLWVTPPAGDVGNSTLIVNAPNNLCPSEDINKHHALSRRSEPAEGTKAKPVNFSKSEPKKRSKFGFPKKQLAALSQAVRAGTKTGGKTLQVLVYEDEEKPDGTVTRLKEAKRFEIGDKRAQLDVSGGVSTNETTMTVAVHPTSPDSKHRAEEILRNSYVTLDSLEQTIKQLETSISEIDPWKLDKPASGLPEVCPHQMNDPLDKSPYEAASPSDSKLTKALYRKPPKPQLLPQPAAVVVPCSATAGQKSTIIATTSRPMPEPMDTKPRQQPGITEKVGRQQRLQEAERVFRQANGKAKRTAGDIAASLTFPASKIPAACPGSGKSSSPPAPNSEATNPAHSSASSKSSIPSPHGPHSTVPHSNGSPRFPGPPVKFQALSCSPQTQNGKPPPPPTAGLRATRTPGLVGCRPQDRNHSKPAIAASSPPKDMA